MCDTKLRKLRMQLHSHNRFGSRVQILGNLSDQTLCFRGIVFQKLIFEAFMLHDPLFQMMWLS